MPVMISLLDLIPLDEKKKFWPDTFRHICGNIEQQIDPTVRPDVLNDIDDTMPTPVEAHTEGEEPKKKPELKPFDRTPMHAMVDWCKENDEPWLERAARFLCKHQGIMAERYRASYGDTRYWRFVDKTMPDRWKYLSGTESSFAALFAVLATEIKKRIEEIDA